MGRKLIVIVSTLEALRVALSSDLEALCIYHALEYEMGASLLTIMAEAGFYPDGTKDSRGMVFVRRKKERGDSQ